MDKELRELKHEYLKENTVHFSETDREGIYRKINQSDKRNNSFSPTRIGLALVAVFLIGFTILFSQLNNNDSHEGLLAPEEDPSIEGYITKINEDGDFLVVSESPNNQMRFDAIWYKDDSIDVDLGRKIRGWHSEAADSYPQQATPDKVEIVPKENVTNANLTKEDALKKALESSDRYSFPHEYIAIHDIRFHEDELIWEVVVANLENKSFMSIRVEDGQNKDSSAFDYAKYGERFPELEERFIEYMNDPESMLNSIGIELNGVAIDDEGTVTVDFKPFQFAFTSNESGQFNQELQEILFSFQEVKQAYFQVNGDKNEFYYTLESYPHPITNREAEPTEFNEREFFERYKAIFDQFVENNENQRLTDFDSLIDVQVELFNVVSTNYIQDLMEMYFYEEDGIYLNATHSPIYLELDEPYDVKRVNHKTYEIKQEHVSDLRGHQFHTYIITFNGANWVIDSLEVEDVHSSIRRLLYNYERTFTHLVENNEDQRLTTYDSIEEIRNDFLQFMTEQQADLLIEDYIYEQDGDIYLTATIMPVFIDTKQSYTTQQIDHETYQVVQEHTSDLRGHVNFIFTIKNVGYRWVVDSVETEQID